MATKTTQRKVLAVLAGGLVLGVGVAVTLAAWNDSEFATGTFTAGAFNMQGSTTSATTGFDDHEDSPGIELTFSTDFDNLSPDDVVYAPFWLQLDGTTTSSATVTTTIDSGTGANVANISYAVYSLDEAEACDASAATNGTLLLSGTSLTAATSTAAADFTLAPGTAGAAGTAQKVCVVATAGSGLAEGAAAAAVWKFEATSTN